MVGDKAAGRGLRAAAVATAVLLGACGQEPAEERLRAQVAAMEQALEEREPGLFMEGVAENFIGERGLDRRGLRGLLAAQMMRNAEVSAVLGPLDIQIQGDQARLAFDVVVTGGAGGFLPERAQAYRVQSGWRDGDEGWQVVEADWEPRL
jgi:hypothetical protein